MKHLSFAVLIALAACGAPSVAPVPPVARDEIAVDDAGRCFSRAAGPVETRIVTAQIEVSPPLRDRNGVVTRPAIFRNVSRPETVERSPGPVFETVCPQVLDAGFVETLQRALIVRRAYAGPITGSYDAPTTEAVRQFQAGRGLDSAILSLETARALGLVAIGR